jgi:hypothetical protein
VGYETPAIKMVIKFLLRIVISLEKEREKGRLQP